MWLKNTCKGWNACEIAGLTLYLQNVFVDLVQFTTRVPDKSGTNATQVQH